MTWVTKVGVNGGRRRATTWVMTWAMTWAMGMMAATTPATMPAKGVVGAGRGGELLADDAAAAAAAAVAAVAMATAVAAYCRGRLLFIVKVFLCVIFMMCGGNWGGHISPHTLVTLEVFRSTFGWGQ
jgi:hypothetical protein